MVPEALVPRDECMITWEEDGSRASPKAAPLGWKKALTTWRWRWWCTAGLLTLGAAALWWHAGRYLPFFTDDAFISLRYSQRLIEGHGLTWTDGERVEGYSNLLWVLLCAIPGVLGFDLVAGARFLGCGSIVLAMGAVLAALRPRHLTDGVPAVAGVALLAASGPTAVWAVGGLETPLVLALLAWGLLLAQRALDGAPPSALWLAAICFGLLCWTRPDGGLWGVTAALGALGGWRLRAARVSLTILTAVGVFVGVQLLFRVAYYDDYLPNTAYAKVSLGNERLEAGFRYLQNSLVPLAAVWSALALLLLTALVRRRARPVTWLLLVPSVCWVAYVVRVGGDFFPAWRHWIPLAAPAALAFCWALRPPGRVDEEAEVTTCADWRWSLTLPVLALVGGWHDPGNWAKAERWGWDGKPVGRMLAEGFGERRPLLAVDAAGAIPFFSGLPSFDMLGLTDRHLAHHRPDTFGTGPLGHELGDADYYWERRPDIVCFAVPPCSFPAKFREQRRFVSKPEFRVSYVPARFIARPGKNELVSELWLLRDGNIGIRGTDTRVVIPAYLLSGRSGNVSTQLDGVRGFVTDWKGEHRSTLKGVALGAGRWHLSAPEYKGEAVLRVKRGRTELGAASVEDGVELHLEEAGTVQIELNVGKRGLRVSELVLERRGPPRP